MTAWRKRRAPDRQVGRYVALGGLLIIAIVLLIQTLRPPERPARPGTQQALVVLRGQATLTCADERTALEAEGRANLSSGCTLRTGAGSEAALSFDYGRILIVLGPNATYTLERSERRQVGQALRIEGALESGKATCWVDGGVLAGAELRLTAGPSKLASRGGQFAAVTYDDQAARLQVYVGKVSVAVGAAGATVVAGQEADLRRGAAITTLANAQEPPALPDLPADLLATPTPAPSATVTATPDALAAPATAQPSSAPGETVYTVQPNDTLSSIAEQYGLTWEELWAANRDTVSSPESLLVGQTLRIPPPTAD
ncbi:MAG: LysM peptidoglycan-binding domain-containing protein [Anaerolineales bacterium]